ncbi:unnamed protein product [Brassica napus]|uniref:CDP-diacylglycerol--inositol 3-phosphatidyltransferase n=1 Tax=Brassica napus TaxID=3708 RepID=A0A816WUS7_BRANA|nr:unnamed protein product [Brassica napus]
MSVSYPISEFVVADTGVFWDIAYCPIPGGLGPEFFYQNIKLALKNMGYYAQPENLPHPVDEVSRPLLCNVSEVWIWKSLATGEKPIYRSGSLQDVGDASACSGSSQGVGHVKRIFGFYRRWVRVSVHFGMRKINPFALWYMRVLLNCVAFAVCFSNKTLFSLLYFFSFCCDAVDGWCARRFNQVSTFGAVLDMVTDRVSTACLLVVLSQVYRPSLVFLSLLALDIASHWLQMYSTFLAGKSSHKDVKDSTSWLFRLYYGNRIFMCYCCVSCEVLYIILLLIAKNQTENLLNVVVVSTLTQISPLSLLLALTIFGWSMKQTVNIIQMKTAADVCVLYDIENQQKKP